MSTKQINLSYYQIICIDTLHIYYNISVVINLVWFTFSIIQICRLYLDIFCRIGGCFINMILQLTVVFLIHERLFRVGLMTSLTILAKISSLEIELERNTMNSCEKSKKPPTPKNVGSG